MAENAARFPSPYVAMVCVEALSFRRPETVYRENVRRRRKARPATDLAQDGHHIYIQMFTTDRICGMLAERPGPTEVKSSRMSSVRDFTQRQKPRMTRMTLPPTPLRAFRLYVRFSCPICLARLASFPAAPEWPATILQQSCQERGDFAAIAAKSQHGIV